MGEFLPSFLPLFTLSCCIVPFLLPSKASAAAALALDVANLATTRSCQAANAADTAAALRYF